MSAIGNPVTKNNPDNVEEKFADIIFLEDDMRNDISNGQDVHEPSGEALSPPGKPIPNSIHAKLDNLESSVSSLGSEFQEKIKNDQHKDQIIERLFLELDTFKNDLAGQMVKPLLNDVISLYDDFDNTIEHFQQTGEDIPVEKVIKILNVFQQHVLTILEKHDVFPYEEPTEEFNPKTQQALTVVETNSPALNRIIKSRLRSGFKRHEKVIRAEGVRVYGYRRPVSHKNGAVKNGFRENGSLDETEQ